MSLIQGQPPSGFVQAPYLVTPQNVDAEGGDQNAFVPTNDYKKRFLALVAARQPASA